MYHGRVDGLAAFADSLHAFCQQIKIMMERYFESLPCWSCAAYAAVYS